MKALIKVIFNDLKRIFILGILMLVTTTSYAQLNQSRQDFLMLKNDSVIYSDSIEYMVPKHIFSRDKFKVGNKIILAKKVKYHREELSYYAVYKGELYPQVYSGNINLYEMMDIQHASQSNSWFSLKKELYSKKLGEPKQINYKNLKKDLFDNPQSLTHLKRSNRISIAQKILIIAGISFVNYSINKHSDTSSINRNEAAFKRKINISLYSTLGVWYFSKLWKQRQLTKAIEVY